MSIQDRLTYLLGRALNQSATDAELTELSDLIGNDQTGDIARQLEDLLQERLSADPAEDYDTAYWDDVAGRILASDRPETAVEGPLPVPVISLRRQSRMRWIPAAAAALLLLSGALYWLLRTAPRQPAVITIIHTPDNDIAPGGNKAVLTLADGTQVPLDSVAKGTLMQQGNTKITQSAGGQLTYTAQKGYNETPAALQYNTLRTPRGGQFQLTLPDGTKVWLNAASSLKYPVAFNGRTRQVELTGEAYFDVARNADMPFRVTVRTGQNRDSLDVAVLGTQFNIMAYEDEALVKTTLLEGAVKVSSGGSNQQLAPGQGAHLDKQYNMLTLQPHVNTEEAVAWKNGYIQLEGNDIASAMRQLVRWYNMDVVYTTPVHAHFRGIIPRSVPVSQVLKMMEMTGEVHFEIRGKQIIVSP